MASEGERQDAAAWLVMAVALGLVVLSWRIAVERDRHDAERRFLAASDDLAAAIVGRIEGCELALRAAAGLFDASRRVDRTEWARFVAALRPVESIPGIAGLGFARAIDEADGAAFVDALRAEGVEDVTVRPASPDGRRAVIELIEPLADPRNRRAIGFDMAADPVRRAAMTIARDTGRPALSGPVILVQDADRAGATPGVLLVRAVARRVHEADDTAPRDAGDRLLGWVYAPMRLDELLRGIAPRDAPGVAFEVLDGDGDAAAPPLYASASIDAPPFDGRRALDLPGRRWTLRVAGTDTFEAAARTARPAQVATVGTVALLLLGLYLRAESRLRHRTDAEAARLAAEVDARRIAERAMRDSERRFREVVEASPIGLLMAGADGRIELANPQAERLFGYGPGALDGRPIDALVPGAARAGHAALRAAYLAAPARRPMGDGRDLHGLRRDGVEIPLEIGLSPVAHGDSTSVLMSIVDLGARHDEQRRVEAMLREKTVLLDEVHHRVKNNLQVITSLLSLQARGASPEVRAALAECRHRVHAMALTHQLLHEHADVARLHVGEYLQRLCRLLADGYRGQAPSVALRVVGRELPLHLELPRAIPCGLLVNELVGHAYRHAFPEGRGGMIEVGVALGDDGARACLWVADDGVGVPIDVDPDAPPPLGLQLVPLLVDQLGGELGRGPGPGSRVEVRFPVRTEPTR